MRTVIRGLAAAMLAIVPASAGLAQSPADFYRGKTVDLQIAYSVGGGYDQYARLIARHMGKHIPGNPTVVPHNMPGAGGMRAANWLQGAAPKDGTVFGGDQPRHGVRAAARQQVRQIRSHQDHLDRQRQRRGQRVHGVAHLRHHDIQAGADSASWSSAPAAPPTTPINSPRSSTTCSAPSSRWCPAMPAAPRSTSRWSAARCRAVAASRGRRSRPRISTGCATRASIC